MQESRQIRSNYWLFLTCFFLFTTSLSAQLVSNSPSAGSTPSNSPTASNLEEHGRVPVNTYNGLPQVAVPLFQMETVGLTMPVGLSYHASGVQVNQVASWVGLGWSLGCGGVITREIRDQPDDAELLRRHYTCVNCNEFSEGFLTIPPTCTGDDAIGCKACPGVGNECFFLQENLPDLGYLYHGQTVENYYNNGAVSVADQQYLYGDMTHIVSGETNGDTPYQRAQFLGGVLHSYYQLPSGEYQVFALAPIPDYHDTEPDVFSFVVGGYSGSFVFDKNGVPKLYSEFDLEIDYTLSTDATIPTSDPTYAGIPNFESNYGGAITEFVITSPDGMQYYFSEKELSFADSRNQQQDFSLSLGNEISDCTGRLKTPYYFDFEGVNATYTSWYLKKVVDGYGNKLFTFDYDNQITVNHSNLTQTLDNCDNRIYFNSAVQTTLGKRLKSVTWGYDNTSMSGQVNDIYGRLEFVATTERPDLYSPFASSAYGGFDRPRSLDKIQWYGADNTTLLKEIAFGYGLFNEASLSCSVDPVDATWVAAHQKRLQLQTVTHQSVSSSDQLVHSFNYDTTPLPPRHSAKQDFWGFYSDVSNSLIPEIYVYSDAFTNNQTLNQKYQSIYSLYPRTTGTSDIIFGADRTVNTTTIQAGILNELTYPTGGTTTFNYEPNEFVEYGFSALPVKGGGLRIQSVTSDAGNGTPPIVNSYVYHVKTSGGLTFPSGQLIDMPLFARYQDNGCGTNAKDNTVVSSGAFTGLTATKGGYVGYESVEEIHENNGSVIYEYSTDGGYGVASHDCSGGQCLYERSTVSSNVNFTEPDKFPYPPNPNYDWNRGLLRKKRYLNETGVEIGEETYEYTLLGSEKVYALRSVADIRSGANLFGYYQDNYLGKYYHISGYKRPTKTTTINKGLDGTANIVTETFTEYNSTNHHFPTATWTTNSDGKIYRTEYTYPPDALPSIPYQALVDRYIISNPIETRKLVGTSLGSLTLVDGARTEYAFYGNVSGTFFNQVGSTQAPRPYQTYRYEKTWDENGNPSAGVWELQNTINNYTQSALPRETTANNWEMTSYVWEKAKLVSKTYQTHTQTNTYYPDTRLLETSTGIDGQVVLHEYDGLQRQKKVTARGGAVVTEFDYQYQNGTAVDNFVKTTTTYTPITGSDLNTLESYTYLDGLGRRKQSVRKEHYINGGSSTDVATTIEYDNRGRIVKSYEPYDTGNSTGAYSTSFTSEPYTLTTYEASPMGRALSATPPSLSSWNPTTSLYGQNTSTISDPLTGYNYTAGELSKTTVIDPNGNKNITYTDKIGRTICAKRTNSSEGASVSTYYAYDDKGREIYVFPPDADSGTPELYYRYVYDGADNVIKKKLPNRYPTELVYDDRDLIVGMQNGILVDEGNRWWISKYDKFGRAKEEGFGTAASLSNPNIPIVIDVQKKYYYDSYLGSSNAIDVGKMLRSEVMELENNGLSNIWIRTNYVYDTHGRLQITNGTNNLNQSINAETNTFVYDYADNLVFHSRMHSPDNVNTINILRGKSYDHQGRLKKVRFTTDGIQKDICEFSYTPKNEVKQKQLGYSPSGYLQDVDYFYNSQGWLTSINTVNDTGSDLMDCGGTTTFGATASSAGADLFSMNIRYNTIDGDFNISPQQNGNISQLTWRVDGYKMQTYGFDYDYLNRLTKADYGQYDGGFAGLTGLQATGTYNTTYQYDDRGNITALQRHGRRKLTNGCYENGLIDDLNYTYSTKSDQLQTIDDLTNGGCLPVIYVAQQQTGTTLLSAVDLVSATTPIQTGSNVTYQAEECVELNPDFEVPLGTDFLGHIAPCVGSTSPFSSEGFNQQSTDSYEYDKAGNVTYDPNKQINIAYNFLDLPYRITSVDETQEILINYDSDGNTLSREVKQDGTTLYTRYYVGGIEYENTKLDVVYFSDGRAVNTGTTSSPQWEYEYYLSDHLGNTRVVFKDDGTGNAEIKQASHYYPYGLRMNGMFTDDSTNPYRYNGIEHVDDFDLGIDMAMYRSYDPTIGRWWQIDPKAGATSGLSPYQAMNNNPVAFADPEGDIAWFAVGLAAGIGAFNGYQIGKSQGASGLGMFGYIAGGALIGGASAGIGSTLSAGIGKIISLHYGGTIAGALGGAAGGTLAGAGFSGLSGQNILEGAWKGGLSGLLGGATGAYGGGGSGAFLGGFSSSSLNSALYGESLGRSLTSGLTGGIVGYGTHRCLHILVIKKCHRASG